MILILLILNVIVGGLLVVGTGLVRGIVMMRITDVHVQLCKEEILNEKALLEKYGDQIDPVRPARFWVLDAFDMLTLLGWAGMVVLLLNSVVLVKAFRLCRKGAVLPEG